MTKRQDRAFVKKLDDNQIQLILKDFYSSDISRQMLLGLVETRSISDLEFSTKPGYESTILYNINEDPENYVSEDEKED